MSPWLKIAGIFVLFIGSITTVALLAGNDPAPAPTEGPVLFATASPPLVAPQEEAAPTPEVTTDPAPRRVAPAAVTSTPTPTPRPRLSGSSSVDEAAFEEGSDCDGKNKIKVKGGSDSNQVPSGGDDDDEDDDCDR